MKTADPTRRKPTTRPQRVLLLCGLAAASFGFAGDGLSEFLIERWASLGEQRQTELRDQWVRFKNLTEQEQQDLLEYHEVLRDAVPKVMASLDPAERARIDGLEGPERRAALRPHLKEWLRKEQERVTGPLEGDPTFMEGGEVQLGALQEAARMRAASKLYDMEKRGLLKPGVAEQLYDLPPWQLKKALRKIRKQATFERPPKWFRNLSSAEKEDLRGLSPEDFAKRARKLRGRSGKQDTSEMIEKILGPRKGGRRSMGFVRQLASDPANARAMMNEHLTEEQLAELAGLRGKERKHQGMRQLRENAEQALLDRGVSADEVGEVFTELDGLSNKARLPYLIRLIRGRPAGAARSVSPGGRGGRRGPMRDRRE